MARKLKLREINTLAKKETLTISAFNDMFGTKVKAGDTFQVLNAYTKVNDQLLQYGIKLSSRDYYNSFKIEVDADKITNYYQRKVANAAKRSASVGITRTYDAIKRTKATINSK